MGVWVVVVGALNLVVPQLETTAATRSAAIVPNDLPSTKALVQMSHDFGADPSTAVGSVVLASDREFGEAEAKYYASVVQRLVRDKEHVSYVLDMYGNPATADFAISPDRRAVTLFFAERGDIGTSAAHRSTEAIRALTEEIPRPPGLTADVTGPAPTVVDEFTSMDTSMVVITAVSVLLISILLVASYRSVFAAMVPLLTIGVSLAASRAVVSLLGGHGALPVSTLTVTLMTVLVLAAGTDYAIFQVSAFHDRRRAGDPSAHAVVGAGRSVGEVLVASALTIAASATAMIFAKNGMFTTSGPPIAIGLLVTLAVSLSFTPAVMAILGRRGRLEPRLSRDMVWRRRGRWILRRGTALTAAVVLVLLALAVPLLTYQPTGDDNAMQLHPTGSSRGYDAVKKHFGVDEINPEYLIIRSDHDMRTSSDLAALDRAAAAVADLPTVERVRFLTRPTGTQLPASTVGYQAGVLGDRLGDAGTQISTALPQLDRLVAGTTALRDGAQRAHEQMPQLVAGVDQIVSTAESTLDLLPAANQLASARTPDGRSLDEVLTELQPAVTTLGSVADLLDRQRALIDPVLAVLAPLASGGPCAAGPTCSPDRALFTQLDTATGGALGTAVRAAGAVSGLPPSTAATLQQALPRLRDGLEAVRSLTASFGGRSPEQIRADLYRLRSGMSQLSTGVTQLATGLSQVEGGTRATATMTRQLRDGLGDATTYLRQLSAATSSGPGAGFFLPPEALKDPQFVAGSKLLMSDDGHIARMLVIPAVNPYGHTAVENVHRIADTARGALQGSTLAHANVSSTGLTSITGDIIDQSQRDFALFAVVALVAVTLILIVLLRSLVAPLVLVATVVLSFAAAAGLGVLVWQHIIGIDLHWSVLPVAFMCLVAVGADYSMLFASRVRELSGSGTTSGLLRAFGSTGRVITTAGVVFAVTMFALMSGSVILVLQDGFIIGVGLLIDIALVRTILVPGLLHLLGPAMWWPSRR
ncbi:MMPL family transporter [Gordonia sp. N1V]|uniref:MMPL family transporter n=1 Tax=Gordonia sp. N1V TaxID=3034163 RepID=UPI0023E094F0|nr:MMPL family transporter [Gordonia sp. N1V]MDF3283905.1 MMPL family transporter [Gordonia sp. N1V]